MIKKVSAINVVEEQINSLINDSKLSSEKIILGVPFYTRLWTEKNASEKPTSVVYSMQDCLDFVNQNKITTVWDEDAGQNYAELKKGDLTYKLWLEDSDSMRKRVEVVNKFRLAGLSAWQKGLEINSVWDTINSTLEK